MESPAGPPIGVTPGKMQRCFVGPDAFGFSYAVSGHEQSLVVLRACAEKFQMLDIQFASELAGSRVKGFDLMLFAVL
jgi:hypothetical protein